MEHLNLNTQQLEEAILALHDRIAKLERAIPIVTDGRFDADTAIERMEEYYAENPEEQ